MKIIKHISVVILTIVVIAVICFTLFNYMQERRMLNIVKSNHVVIDQAIHEWSICKQEDPVKIEMYVRNSGEYKLNGTLVFSVTLSRKGLDEKFLQEFINCYGKERLKEELKNEIDTKGSNPRLQAIYNYIIRGKKLLPGQEYESSSEKNAVKDYTFKFRKPISLGPGEISKINHEQQIPFNERGHLLRATIENIEF